MSLLKLFRYPRSSKAAFIGQQDFTYYKVGSVCFVVTVAWVQFRFFYLFYNATSDCTITYAYTKTSFCFDGTEKKNKKIEFHMHA